MLGDPPEGPQHESPPWNQLFPIVQDPRLMEIYKLAWGQMMERISVAIGHSEFSPIPPLKGPQWSLLFNFIFAK